MKIRFSAIAYGKMMLHAAKYPHCAVNGILLARPDYETTKILDLCDAIPLFHDCIYISPMAEIALTQVDHWAETQGLIIAGYYTATEYVLKKGPERLFTKIADKIAEHFPPCVLAVFDNAKLSPHPQAREFPLKVSQQSDGKWRPIDNVVLYPADAHTAISALVREKVQRELVDFDNHLNDINEDWTNEHIGNSIEQILKLYECDEAAC